MRDAFAAEITALAERDERIVLLSGDIGNRLFDGFKARFPRRFYNCGVAEQNMISVAAGMALAGMRPVTYTIASFTTARCWEQIRVDVCYHNAPVMIVGVGAGLAYAANGCTHHTPEDIATLRVLPNLTVVCPGDPWEVKAALRAAVEHPGPVYLRLGKKGEPLVHAALPQFSLGKGIVVRSGCDACLISTGNILPVAIEAAELLESRGVSTQVVSMHTVKPLDESLLADAFTRHAVVATIEEHGRSGGLGGAVAEWLADQTPPQARLVRIGMANAFFHEAGEQEHARSWFGLTAERIVGEVLRNLSRTASSRAELSLA